MEFALELAIRRALASGAWYDAIDICCMVYADAAYGKSVSDTTMRQFCLELCEEGILEHDSKQRRFRIA